MTLRILEGVDNLASSVEDLDDEKEGYEHRKGNQEHQVPAPFLLSGFDEVLFAFRAAELLSPGYGTAATKAMAVILNQDGTLTKGEGIDINSFRILGLLPSVGLS